MLLSIIGIPEKSGIKKPYCDFTHIFVISHILFVKHVNSFAMKYLNSNCIVYLFAQQMQTFSGASAH